MGPALPFLIVTCLNLNHQGQVDFNGQIQYTDIFFYWILLKSYISAIHSDNQPSSSHLPRGLLYSDLIRLQQRKELPLLLKVLMEMEAERNLD
jgi:hypothetical protein